MMAESGDTRETITINGSIIEVKNALVEEMYTSNSRTGYLIISYAVAGENDMVNIELVQLNIGWDTILIDQFGETISLCSILKGTYVNAAFSTVMTRSIPPQSNAYRVIAMLEVTSYVVTTDRIVWIDPENHFVYTGNPNDERGQMRFLITNATQILDQNGTPVTLADLVPGEMVRIKHASFQTASIPPQTNAYVIEMVSN
ncbi:MULTISPECIES: hypothetical protein [Lacrimispora]|jgi:hypothetical protein|uniref:hypothetical protein n=1 Tax=Lacrimispora TaxID=2719231 RepID=UPI000BE2A247|nr:hypothetical protein [Lacrimispora amygdalina]MDK2967892.1 hypothetical protein [Lacrimispora sp.]